MSDKAKQIVKAILADVTDRRGWRQAWDEFDEDIKQEIQESWEGIVNEILREKKI